MSRYLLFSWCVRGRVITRQHLGRRSLGVVHVNEGTEWVCAKSSSKCALIPINIVNAKGYSHTHEQTALPAEYNIGVCRRRTGEGNPHRILIGTVMECFDVHEPINTISTGHTCSRLGVRACQTTNRGPGLRGKVILHPVLTLSSIGD